MRSVLPEITPSLLIDFLITSLFALLYWEIKRHIADDAEAHKQLKKDAEKYSNDEDSHLEKRIERIEKYLNGKLK
jgi:hypothetical protein